jgi:hypothetical protein
MLIGELIEAVVKEKAKSKASKMPNMGFANLIMAYCIIQDKFGNDTHVRNIETDDGSIFVTIDDGEALKRIEWEVIL